MYFYNNIPNSFIEFNYVFMSSFKFNYLLLFSMFCGYKQSCDEHLCTWGLYNPILGKILPVRRIWIFKTIFDTVFQIIFQKIESNLHSSKNMD